MEQEKQHYVQQGYDVIMDIPLLFENDLQDTVDEVWLVYTSESVQIERLMKRNNLDLDQQKREFIVKYQLIKKQNG